MKIISAILTVCISTPIWFYLLYKILSAVGATDVMWLLYVVYVPIGIVANLIYLIANKES